MGKNTHQKVGKKGWEPLGGSLITTIGDTPRICKTINYDSVKKTVGEK